MRFRMILAGVSGSLFLASPALAHLGHDQGNGESGFTTGFLHPFTGMDHLLAILMFGLWAGLAFRREWWVPSSLFIGFVAVGFAWGAEGGHLPFFEIVILASLGLLAMALVFKLRPKLSIAALLIALCAVAHGFAHGVEVPAGSSPGAFLAGFLAAALLILSAGLGAATFARRRGTVLSAVGSWR